MRRILLSTMLAALAGCGTSGDPVADRIQTAPSMGTIRETEGTVYFPQGTNVRAFSATVEASPEAAWRAAMEVYRSMEIPLGVLEQASGVLGNRDLAARRRLAGQPMTEFLDCGRSVTGPAASTHQIHLSILTSVRAAATGGTELRTQLQATARQPGSSSPPTQCATTGRLEQQIAHQIQLRLLGVGG
jgi:hypothetical protein